MKVSLNQNRKHLTLLSILIFIVVILWLNITKEILLWPTVIAIINLGIIFYVLTTKYFKHMIFKIYYSYHLITMILPMIIVVLFYSPNDIHLFLSNKLMIDDNDLLKSNLLILFYDLSVIVAVIIYNKMGLFKDTKGRIFKYYLLNSNKYFIIILIAFISYFMKIYLISIGAWFMYVDVDLTQYPLANTADVLQKLDIVILLYFAYNYKYDKSKKFLIFMITIVTISLFFAVISTSKEKLFIVLIPIVFLLLQSRYKKSYLAIILILFINSGVLFEYFMYLRLNSNQSIIDNTVNFTSQKKVQHEKKDILDNKLLERLGYQFVFSKAIQVYDTPNLEMKSDYLYNIIGLIPRVIWPDKPRIISGNQFGHDLGILYKGDTRTSIGITPVGEAFYELGYLGVFIVPWFISLLLFAFSKWFNENTWIGFMMMIMIGLELGTSDKYSPLVPILIKSFIIFYIFGLLLNKKYHDEIRLKVKF